MGLLGVIIVLLAVVSVWWRARRTGGKLPGVDVRIVPTPAPRVGPAPASKPSDSILTGVTDAGASAAVLLYGLAALKGPVGPEHEERIEHLLETVCRMNPRDRTEAVAFASWASAHIPDPNEIVQRFLPTWREVLEAEQRRELVGMCQDVVQMDGPATDAQRIAVRRLSDALLRQ